METCIQTASGKYEQRIVYARAGLWIPFYIVGMVGRLEGNVPVEPVEAALRKLKLLYPQLACRVYLQEDGGAWLTTQGANEFILECRPRKSADDWIGVFLEKERQPVPFDTGPLTRFVLLRGETTSDLLVIVPHVICDGGAMATVISDLVDLINDPGRVVERPANVPQISWQTVDHRPTDAIWLRGLTRAINRFYTGKRPVFDQQRYERIHRVYWERTQNGMVSFCLSAGETKTLADRCRERGVTVTGALVAAFLLAGGRHLPGWNGKPAEISVAVNVRDRLINPPEHVVGVYSSAINLKIDHRPGLGFWELAKKSYTIIHKGLNDPGLILRPLVLEELDPRITDVFVESVATDCWDNGLDLLTRFINVKGDVRSLDVSNIGRVSLNGVKHHYRLQTIFPLPPLAPGGGIALNVMTVDGQMNIIVKYNAKQLDEEDINAIRDIALKYLRCER